MLLRSIGAVLLAAGAANGFKNSSPFLMLSTQPSKGGLESAVVNTADKVTDAILAAVGDCEQTKYWILQQPGLTIADLQSDAASSLRSWSAGSAFEQRNKIDNVISEINADELAGKIASKCGVAREEGLFVRPGVATEMFVGEGKEVALAKFEPLPEVADKRREALGQLHSALADDLPKPTEDHMVIILSAPVITLDHAAKIYEMDEPYPSALHQGLKRDNEFEPFKSNGNKTMQDGLPLFEKYQFLSPGIFMGLTVSLLLLIILWVGVSAIAGLEVSYMAFSKEMGPAAQNKGKQQ